MHLRTAKSCFQRRVSNRATLDTIADILLAGLMQLCFMLQVLDGNILKLHERLSAASVQQHVHLWIEADSADMHVRQ